ncbi:MAG: ABC transporter ATP-binding protein [Lachnospiraceae bacterium]|nr:ABC transporter ATP-binding protein [Lachnospiraceae bacterium]
MDDSYVIELKNVKKDYGDFVLDNVSFCVPTGSVCGFIGQNGAGKTTTIQIILDAIKRDGGEVYVFGKNIDDGMAALKEDIGVVFDEMGFHDFLTPKQINTVMKNIYQNWDENAFFDYLKKFSLPSKKECGKFSRGMRMKLQIATAMSHKAKLLIMDEPTSGLDPIVRNEIIQIFREFVIEEDHSILLSSHITTDLEKIADEVVFIDAGKIVLSGNKDEIIEKHGILRCKKDEVKEISKSLIVDVDVSSMGAEILVNDKKAASKLYPGMVTDEAGLEQIMIHYVNSSKAISISENSGR